jgi:hypothetical protein
MDEIGLAMRQNARKPDESYLFQKIGFAKDHYEYDESSFNWYAKGTPMCMDYGTYTGDIAIGAAHNLVEIPDEDPLRRGYVKQHFFTGPIDYSHAELPVSLKLLWGKVRTFADIDDKDGKVAREKTPYFYIGDKNPIGPKVWKVRQLLYVKPDYLVLFDRVYGDVPHRYNLHFTGDNLKRDGQMLHGHGRFDLDLQVLVQHPKDFKMETGRISPGNRVPPAENKQTQDYFRLYNQTDGIYRTVLFARERNRALSMIPVGNHGVKVVTPEYTDYVFLHNQDIREDFVDAGQTVSFVGQGGWIRKNSDGSIQAMMINGQSMAAFGKTFDGQGPWTFNLHKDGKARLLDGPPRPLSVDRAVHPMV